MPFYPAPLPLTSNGNQVSEITAGTNVTITTNAGNATIASTGGGGGGAVNLGAYTDVTSSRAFNTTYTNSNTTALKVLGWGYSGGSGGGYEFFVNGVQVAYFGNTTDNAPGFNYDVPAGATYELVKSQAGASLTKWFEAVWA